MTLDEIKEGISRKNREIDELRAEVAELNVKNDDLVARNMELEDEITALRTERDFHESRSKEFQRALIARAEEMNYIKEELNQLREKCHG